MLELVFSFLAPFWPLLLIAFIAHFLWFFTSCVDRAANRRVAPRIAALEEEKQKLRSEAILSLEHEKQKLRIEAQSPLRQQAALTAEAEKKAKSIQADLDALKADLDRILSSNVASIPWLAGMMADFLTYELELKAKMLDWGSDMRRLKKVDDIRSIRAEARRYVEESKAASYQLAYLLQLYPALDEVINTEYTSLGFIGEIPDQDPAKGYLSKEEWDSLTPVQRDQLALDRYINSHKKSPWQIGRDYELAVAYEYQKKGYTVDTFGSRMGLNDLGRDLIARNSERVLIIQCKYWSQKKTIHEKHLFQLFGTVVLYKLDHRDLTRSVSAVFITNTTLSETALAVAKELNIAVVQRHKMIEFPRIKCNIGRDEFGGETRIYHLPMDAQYDITQIKDPGEFYAFTVAEARAAGFRRAYKWHGQ